MNRKLFSFILATMLILLCGMASSEEAAQTAADRSISITSEVLTVAVSKQLKLTTEITKLTDEAPAKTTLEWKSEDESIAKVNAQGVVTGVAPGTVSVTCLAKDNSAITASATVTVIQPIKTIKPEKDNILLLLGSSEDAAKGKITAVITPENATVQQCSYSSSDEAVVTVDENGNLQAVGEGKAKITIIPLENGSKLKAVCNVNVGQAVSSISIPSTQVINKKKTITLKPEISPANAFEKKIVYSSSNEKVASVNNKGVITGVGCGTATITCTATDGSGVSASCEVTVIQPVTKISNKDRRIVLFQGKEQKWRPTVDPSDATNKTLSFTSDDFSVASVSSDGEISGKRGGKTRITATTTDGSNKKCTVEVIVEPSVPISLDSIGHGVFNYNLLGITVTNQCSTLTIVDFDFDMSFYDWGGSKINGGSYSLGKEEKIGPRKQKTIKRTVYGSGQAYKTVITITGVKFSDGSYWYIPSSQQETWSFTRN